MLLFRQSYILHILNLALLLSDMIYLQFITVFQNMDAQSEDLDS